MLILIKSLLSIEISTTVFIHPCDYLIYPTCYLLPQWLSCFVQPVYLCISALPCSLFPARLVSSKLLLILRILRTLCILVFRDVLDSVYSLVTFLLKTSCVTLIKDFVFGLCTLTLYGHKCYFIWHQQT